MTGRMAILAVGFDVTMYFLLVLLPVAGGLLAVVLSGVAGRIALYLEDMTYRLRARSSAKRPPLSDTVRESVSSPKVNSEGLLPTVGYQTPPLRCEINPLTSRRSSEQRLTQIT